jgi:hypothetical protein
VYNSFVEPEVSRILAALKYGDSINLENFGVSSKLFYFFPRLNADPALEDFRKDLYSNKFTIEQLNVKHGKAVADVIIDEFTKSSISNYKSLASIYKLFEATISTEAYEPKDIFNSKFTIIENITNSSIQTKDKLPNDRVLDEYRNQDESIRILSYKLLVENFNKKYSNLSIGQRKLLKDYINNINNTGKLKEYVDTEVNTLSEGLKQIGVDITDKVTKIKLAETISNIKKIKSVKKLRESHLSALMMSYELLKELKNTLNK